MGTPGFAVPSLQALIAGNHEVCAVVTQPDRPKGRKKKLAPPPVKLAALKNKLPLFQLPDVNDVKFIRTLVKLAPELIVVVAFGQLLSKNILDLPEHGCINLHPSLLPRYRGASPIESAILNGEVETGVTTFYMSQKLDAGDIIFQEGLEISPDDTAKSLSNRLSQLGAQVLTRTINLIAKGEVSPVPQDESGASYTTKLKSHDGLIDWSQAAPKIHNLVRGMNPWPGAYTEVHGSGLRAGGRGNRQVLKIWKTGKIVTSYQLPVTSYQPGQIVDVTKESMVVACGKGRIEILEVQPANRRVMTAGEYLRGRRVTKGILLGAGGDARQ